MQALVEHLDNGRTWLRVASPAWTDPIDTTYALEAGGRWNAPGTCHTLYLCADVATARTQIRRWTSGRFVDVEDLRDDYLTLIPVTLPTGQTAADAHTIPGLKALGLPQTYPHDQTGNTIPHYICQPIGADVAAAGVTGVHAMATTPTATHANTELAWFTSVEGPPAITAGPGQLYGT